MTVLNDVTSEELIQKILKPYQLTLTEVLQVLDRNIDVDRAEEVEVMKSSSDQNNNHSADSPSDQESPLSNNLNSQIIEPDQNLIDTREIAFKPAESKSLNDIKESKSSKQVPKSAQTSENIETPVVGKSLQKVEDNNFSDHEIENSRHESPELPRVHRLNQSIKSTHFTADNRQKDHRLIPIKRHRSDINMPKKHSEPLQSAPERPSSGSTANKNIQITTEHNSVAGIDRVSIENPNLESINRAEVNSKSPEKNILASYSKNDGSNTSITTQEQTSALPPITSELNSVSRLDNPPEERITSHYSNVEPKNGTSVKLNLESLEQSSNLEPEIVDSSEALVKRDNSTLETKRAPKSRELTDISKLVEKGMEPVLDQAYEKTNQTLLNATTPISDDAQEEQFGRVNNTFNVNVSLSPEKKESKQQLQDLEESLVEILKMAARRQGLEV